MARDGTVEPVSRDQKLRRGREQGNMIFPCSADHEQDWQAYTVDPYSGLNLVLTHGISLCVPMTFTAESPPAQCQKTNHPSLDLQATSREFLNAQDFSSCRSAEER